MEHRVLPQTSIPDTRARRRSTCVRSAPRPPCTSRTREGTAPPGWAPSLRPPTSEAPLHASLYVVVDRLPVHTPLVAPNFAAGFVRFPRAHVNHGSLTVASMRRAARRLDTPTLIEGLPGPAPVLLAAVERGPDVCGSRLRRP